MFHCDRDKHYNGLEIFSSHHFQTRTAFSFPAGMISDSALLTAQADVPAGHPSDQTCTSQAGLVSLGRTHLCSPFWLSSFDQDRHSSQHPSYPNCFSLPGPWYKGAPWLWAQPWSLPNETMGSAPCCAWQWEKQEAIATSHDLKANNTHFVHLVLRSPHKAKALSKPISFKINWKRRL